MIEGSKSAKLQKNNWSTEAKATIITAVLSILISSVVSYGFYASNRKVAAENSAAIIFYDINNTLNSIQATLQKANINDYKLFIQGAEEIQTLYDPRNTETVVGATPLSNLNNEQLNIHLSNIKQMISKSDYENILNFYNQVEQAEYARTAASHVIRDTNADQDELIYTLRDYYQTLMHTTLLYQQDSLRNTFDKLRSLGKVG